MHKRALASFLLIVGCSRAPEGPPAPSPPPTSAPSPASRAPPPLAPAPQPVPPPAVVSPALPAALAGRYARRCWVEPVPVLSPIAPCTLRDDFDGDGSVDTADLVEDERRRRGVAFAFAGGGTAVAGAGLTIGNGGDDFEWMDAWRLVRRGDPALPRWAKGAGVLVERTESAAGVVAWDGKRLRWAQHGD